MKHRNRIWITLSNLAAISLAVAGISIRTLASQPIPSNDMELQSATSSNATAASPSGANDSDDEDYSSELENDLLTDNFEHHTATPSAAFLETEEYEYTLCGYYFFCCDNILEWTLGQDFDAAMELSDTVEVYLDGPDGHIDDYLELPAQWDVSEVDFTKEGTYSITGILDTGSYEHLLDWDNTPPPVLTIKIIKGGTMSFQPEFNGNTLILNYEMNGSPFLSEGSMYLYESTDHGASWYDITQRAGVRIFKDHLSISGITSDSLYQITGLRLFNGYSSCSDIVEVKAAGEISSVEIISSGGMAGGDQWNEECGSIWYDEPVLDGPYPILEYKTQIPRLQPLRLQILKGDKDFLNREWLESIYVYYGDAPDGFWHRSLLLPVIWDWTPADTIDWNQTGDTVIYGHFPEETLNEYGGLLDFTNMPQLALTISVISPESVFNIYAAEERLFENNTVYFQYYGEDDAPLIFEDSSALTVWCSDDGSESWYNITKEPSVNVTGSTFSVSALKESILRNNGYTFQIEQTEFPDHEHYSCALNVNHGTLGVNFGIDAGGERGGGKRYEKPPEGLFDIIGQETPNEPGNSPSEPVESPSEPGESPSEPGGTPDSPDNSDGNTDPGLSRPSTDDTQGPSDLNTGGSSNDSDSGFENSNNGSDNNDSSSGSKGSQKRDNSNSSNTSGNGNKAAGDSAVKNDYKSTVSESRFDRTNVINNEKRNEPIPAAMSSTPAASAKPPSSSSITASELNSETESVTISQPETADNVISYDSSPQDNGNGIFRIIVSISAVLTGGIAGFYMIRRR